MVDKKILIRICGVNLRKALRTPRTYVAVLWVGVVFYGFVVGVREFCALSGLDVSPWMIPFLTGMSGNQLFIILGALLVFCDAPFLTPHSMWQVARSGRMNWFCGSMLYIFFMSFLYTAVCCILPVVMMVPRLGWTIGWGKVLGTLTDAAASYYVGLKPISEALMVHYSPVTATLLTGLSIWLNTMLIGYVNFTLNFTVWNGLGAVLSAVIGLSPLLISKLANYTRGYYLSPPLWMSLEYYRWKGYGYGVTFSYAYLFLTVSILALIVVSYYAVQKKDLDFMEVI